MTRRHLNALSWVAILAGGASAVLVSTNPQAGVVLGLLAFVTIIVVNWKAEVLRSREVAPPTTASKIARLVLDSDGLGKTGATVSIAFGDPDAPSPEDCDAANQLMELLLQLTNEQVPPAKPSA